MQGRQIQDFVNKIPKIEYVEDSDEIDNDYVEQALYEEYPMRRAKFADDANNQVNELDQDFALKQMIGLRQVDEAAATTESVSQ